MVLRLSPRLLNLATDFFAKAAISVANGNYVPGDIDNCWLWSHSHLLILDQYEVSMYLAKWFH